MHESNPRRRCTWIGKSPRRRVESSIGQPFDHLDDATPIDVHGLSAYIYRKEKRDYVDRQHACDFAIIIVPKFQMRVCMLCAIKRTSKTSMHGTQETGKKERESYKGSNRDLITMGTMDLGWTPAWGPAGVIKSR